MKELLAAFRFIAAVMPKGLPAAANRPALLGAEIRALDDTRVRITATTGACLHTAVLKLTHHGLGEDFVFSATADSVRDLLTYKPIKGEPAFLTPDGERLTVGIMRRLQPMPEPFVNWSRALNPVEEGAAVCPVDVHLLQASTTALAKYMRVANPGGPAVRLLGRRDTQLSVEPVADHMAGTMALISGYRI